MTKLIFLIQIPCGTLFVWVRIFAFFCPQVKKQKFKIEDTVKCRLRRFVKERKRLQNMKNTSMNQILPHREAWPVFFFC